MQITVETLVKAPIAKVWSAYTTPEDNGGLGIACSWCRDKWGISWQIAPAMLRSRSKLAQTSLVREAVTSHLAVEFLLSWDHALEPRMEHG